MKNDKNLPKRILITGATGNVGMSVIEAFMNFGLVQEVEVIAAVRKVKEAKSQLKNWQNKIGFRTFDFEDSVTFETALEGIDAVFLLRPPQIADVEGVFEPLIAQIKKVGIREIVFLSVQGVEQSKVIPHNKIEKAIEVAEIPFVFLRPSYFMQNLTTTLGKDLKEKKQIILPAGNAVFNWVDVKDIGEIAAKVLVDFSRYKSQKIEITGDENLNFQTVTNRMNQLLEININYQSVNPMRYFFIKRKENVPKGMIIVMILLHFLPRFQKAPIFSDAVKRILKRQSTDLNGFIKREVAGFLKV